MAVDKAECGSVNWRQLEPGLSEAQSSDKPAMIVFATKVYSGPATFKDTRLMPALASYGPIPIKVTPPDAPMIPAGASSEQVKAMQDAYLEAAKKYNEALAKYRVQFNPMVVITTSDGDAVRWLSNPSPTDMLEAMGCLPSLTRGFWSDLSSGLEKAKGGNKPAVLVFAPRTYSGPATFATEQLTRQLRESGAVPIRVLQPELPVIPKDATQEKARELQAAYDEADKKFRETMAQYGAGGLPSLIYLNPEGAVVRRQVAPSHGDVTMSLRLL
jgi:hypothetical protein